MESSQPHRTEPATDGPSLRSGDLLGGRFCIERFIAAGGMGEIYEARDRELGERVALKTIRPEIAADERSMRRFRREIKLARRVTHPNVCRTLDLVPNATLAGRAPVTFVTMELLEGETLGHRLATLGRLSPEQALPIVRQIVAALTAAHAAGVIHRDLKSANVVLVPAPEGERAVVTDFGLARLDPTAKAISSGSLPLTETVGIAGTPAYMTPEQLEGGQITPATDVYSLGVLVYEMLTGTYPFHGDTFLAMAVARLRQDPLPPRAYLPELDPRWDAAVMRCLARDPQTRFAAPRELLDALEEGCSAPVGPPAATAPAAAAPRARTALAITTPALAVVLVAVLALGMVWSLRPPAGQRPEAATPGARRPHLVFGGLRDLAPSEATRALDQQLTAELERALAAHGLLVATETGSEAAAELELTGTCFSAGTGGQVRIDLRLRTPSGEVRAAISETGRANDLAGLAERAAARLAEAIGDAGREER